MTWAIAALRRPHPRCHARSLPLALAAVVLCSACAAVGTEPMPGQPLHHVNGGFRNPDGDTGQSRGWTRVRFWFSRFWANGIASRSFEAPRVDNDGAMLSSEGSSPTVTWIGHSTLLVQLEGVNLLTDPHWGLRASLFSWAGPRRLSAPGLPFERLPPIHVVLVSHDHYDHLDRDTVKRLALAHDPLFLVPLGLQRWFADQGITRVQELDWWQVHEHRGLQFVCLPAHHRAQRTPWDSNTRLWASWAAIRATRRFYFSGDTRYFDGFKQTGERLGPFDLAAVGIGTYMPPRIMRASHTNPEDAVQAFEDLRGQILLGIHWGTFDISEEPLAEPPERMLAEARRRGIAPERAWIFKLGETRRW
jgi:N-acyl-phosphatidylethanolamine-hydrolysing phospholipase D